MRQIIKVNSQMKNKKIGPVENFAFVCCNNREVSQMLLKYYCSVKSFCLNRTYREIHNDQHQNYFEYVLFFHA